MDIRHLRYFVGIAECGSLMKASERLNVAQPTLSVHVANLEVELGVKLMERTNRGVTLTLEGQALYERATLLLRQYQDMVGSLKDMRKRPTGLVSLGMPTSSGPIIAADLYRKVRARLPGVKLYIVEASTALIYELLQVGRLDFAILFNLSSDANVVSTPLKVEEFCLVSRWDQADEGETISFERMLERPMVVACEATTWRKALDDIAERTGGAFDAPVETESASVMKAIALSGEASAIMPASSVRAEVAEGALKAQRIVNPEMRGFLSLAHLPTLEMNPARQAVRDLVIEVVRATASEPGETAAMGNVTPILRTVPGKVLPGRAGGRRPRTK